jgi:hypothetical protein
MQQGSFSAVVFHNGEVDAYGEPVRPYIHFCSSSTPMAPIRERSSKGLARVSRGMSVEIGRRCDKGSFVVLPKR